MSPLGRGESVKHVYMSQDCAVIDSYSPTVPLLEGQSRVLVKKLPLSRFFTAFLGTNLSLDLMIFSYFYQICKNVPLFLSLCPAFFTAFLGTNLSLDLIIFSYFYQICENVPLLDQKSHFLKNFVPLFASGRLVSMYIVRLLG